MLFSCPASRDAEGPALLGRAAPLAARGHDLDGMAARGEHAGVVAQVAGGPSVVKAPLLGPVQVKPYVALGEVGPLGFDLGSDGGDRVADVSPRTHGGDGDGASGASGSPTPLGTGSRLAGGLAHGSLDYPFWLWHVRNSSSLLVLLV
jgi:hypothetical protein